MAPLVILAAIGLPAAIYAHTHAARFSTRPMALQLMLALTGLCVGLAALIGFGSAVGFVAGFGAVHIPAACILFLKRRQHAGKP